MAGYKKVRSSSPSREGRGDTKLEALPAGGEEIGLEQLEGLLSREDEDAEKPGRGSPSRDGKRPSRWWLLALVPSALVALLLTAFLLRQVLGGGGGSSAAEADTFRRPSSDYVLDPDWDYGAAPTVREYHWAVQDIEANPDGVFRPMLAINGKFPGELIECNEGDTIVVNVENRAANATSIHWHGIFQNGTNWMDGAPGVTGCPIAPGREFRYEFTVRGQAGTYFYHGHHAAQALDGLVGPLVVHSEDERRHQPAYASDRVVLLQDWYHDPSGGLLLQTLSPGSESSPVPDGALINGAGVVDCAAHPLRRCDNATAGPPELDLAPGRQHRLRLVNAGGFAWFEVSVDRHRDLAVTEVDGVAVEPAPGASVLVGPGQRYSVVLGAHQAGADAFWLRARMLTHCFAENLRPEGGAAEARAVVRYAAGGRAAAGPPPATDNDSGRYAVECRDPPPGTFSPTPPLPAPASADRSYRLRVNLEIGDWRLERGFVNGSTLRPDLRAPALHRVVDGLAAGNASFDVRGGVNRAAFDAGRELVISHGGVEVVDLVLQNMDEGNHPFHLHGARVAVLAAGHGYFPGYEALGLRAGGRGPAGPDGAARLANPTRRDVATVEGFGWTLLRFVADNPGVWAFHCHMIWHGEAGMGMEFVSRLDVLRGWEVPPASRALCDAPPGELEKGAAPKDEIFYGFGG